MVKNSAAEAESPAKKSGGAKTTAAKGAAAKPDAAKPAAAKPAQVKPGQAKPAQAAKPVAKPNAESAGPLLRKKDFIERVLEAAEGVNKSQAKEVIDHVLAQLAQALAKGESLVLPPLGKVKVVKRTTRDKPGQLTVKVKAPSAEGEKTGAEKE